MNHHIFIINQGSESGQFFTKCKMAQAFVDPSMWAFKQTHTFCFLWHLVSVIASRAIAGLYNINSVHAPAWRLVILNDSDWLLCTLFEGLVSICIFLFKIIIMIWWYWLLLFENTIAVITSNETIEHDWMAWFITIITQITMSLQQFCGDFCRTISYTRFSCISYTRFRFKIQDMLNMASTFEVNSKKQSSPRGRHMYDQNSHQSRFVMWPFKFSGIGI